MEPNEHALGSLELGAKLNGEIASRRQLVASTLPVRAGPRARAFYRFRR